MTFFAFIKQDWAANRKNTKGKLICLFFRIANYTSTHRAARLLLTPYLIFYKLVSEWMIGIELPYKLSAGSGLKVYHGQALIVHRNTIIGKNCTLRQSTTIGNNGKNDRCPVLGDNVMVGAHVCIIGGITIGDNVVIGAGSIVTKDIPSNCVVVGNPARIVKYTDQPAATTLAPEFAI